MGWIDGPKAGEGEIEYKSTGVKGGIGVRMFWQLGGGRKGKVGVWD